MRMKPHCLRTWSRVGLRVVGQDRLCSQFLHLGKRCCESELPFTFKWQPNIATQKSTSSPRRWRAHFPTPPSPPLFATPVALPIFSRSSAVGSRFIELTD